VRTVRKAALVVLLAVLAAGCGSRVATRTQLPAAPHPALSLSTALATSAAAWATIPMGAPAGANLFWELFRMPAGGTRWALATPPDVATNGALVLTTRGGQTLVAGVRPSLHLIFSPVTGTSDGGKTWTSSPPQAGLANSPDALAVGPAGQLLALGSNGQADVNRPGSSGWARLTSARALAASTAGRACRLMALSAASYTPAGDPLLGGRCARPGVAGIFAYRGGSWQAAGPVLPGALAGQAHQVLRLTTAGGGNLALLQVGREAGGSLVAAWTVNSGKRWMLSPPLALNGAHPVSTAFSHNGAVAVTLSGGHAETITGATAQWQVLPALPAGRALTLAFPPGGGLDALAAAGSELTVWRLGSRPDAWVKAQAMKVPIQYGSSS